MTRTAKPHHDERDRSGRYTATPLCDACNKPVGTDYVTDDDVCGGTDGPGFHLCERKRCAAKRDQLDVDGRRALYEATRRSRTATRPRTDAYAAQHAAGYVAHHVTPASCLRVAYRAAEAGIDVGARYAVSCETHGTVAPATSQRGARADLRTGGWCEACQALAANPGRAALFELILRYPQIPPARKRELVHAANDAAGKVRVRRVADDRTGTVVGVTSAGDVAIELDGGGQCTEYVRRVGLVDESESGES